MIAAAFLVVLVTLVGVFIAGMQVGMRAGARLHVEAILLFERELQARRLAAWQAGHGDVAMALAAVQGTLETLHERLRGVRPT